MAASTFAGMPWGQDDQNPRGKAHKVVVSGIDGRTFGERPFSWIKLAGYSAAISAAVIAFGLLWGAANIL